LVVCIIGRLLAHCIISVIYCTMVKGLKSLIR
jgi:hypothetical protein